MAENVGRVERLVREALTQSLVLAAAGTTVGLLLATWTTPVLVMLSPEGTDATGSAMRSANSRTVPMRFSYSREGWMFQSCDIRARLS